MSEERRQAFAEGLIRLVNEYNDVPAGARGMDLMVALSALMVAEAGRLPTAREFSECMLAMVAKLAKAGLITSGGPATSSQRSS